MNAADLIAAMRAAEADYVHWHMEADRLWRENDNKRSAEHGEAVAKRDRAESALKTHRAEAHLRLEATTERLEQVTQILMSLPVMQEEVF